jgi:ribosome-binding protein aMBF1 (putative translation factor)
MRTINTTLFNSWLIAHGDLAKEDLASKARIKFHTVRRIAVGEKMPSELEQIALAKAMEIERDELFPVSKQEKSA